MVHWLTLVPAWLSGLAFGVWLARAVDRRRNTQTKRYRFWPHDD